MDIKHLTGDHKTCATKIRRLLDRFSGRLLVWATGDGWACVPAESDKARDIWRTFRPDIAGVFVRGVQVEALRIALRMSRECMLSNGRVRSKRSLRTREYNTRYMREWRNRKREAAA